MERRANRMKPMLFDPHRAPDGAWPAGRETERGYLQAVAQLGVPALVSNAATEWLALRSGERVFPVTVNQDEIGGSYVCLPHSAYVLYARQELDIVDAGWSKHVLRPVIAPLDRLLRAARINTNVQIDNWLLSTNLHGDWNGADLPAIREILAARFPDHFLLLRSLDTWSCPDLLAAARADGWILVPSRQVWVIEDIVRDWLPRHDIKNDRRKLRQSGLRVEELSNILPADAERIAALYHQLYVGKYSALNPVFTPAFVVMTHRAGMIRYHVARDAAGQIMAVGGLFQRSGIATPPVVGYDTSHPQSEGLYRIACLLFTDPALAAGWRLNGSAGAGDFKRRRGAQGVIEYSAFFAGHLPPMRQRIISALAAMLECFVVPMMRRRSL
jgi:hypothetical protein